MTLFGPSLYDSFLDMSFKNSSTCLLHVNDVGHRNDMSMMNTKDIEIKAAAHPGWRMVRASASSFGPPPLQLLFFGEVFTMWK